MKFIIWIIVLPALWCVLGNALFGSSYFTDGGGISYFTGGELLNAIMWNIPFCLLCSTVLATNWSN